MGKYEKSDGYFYYFPKCHILKSNILMNNSFLYLSIVTFNVVKVITYIILAIYIDSLVSFLWSLSCS